MTSEPNKPDELTAYLDGELNVEASRHIEERLARDGSYREELHRLERAWDLLDQLPRCQVDPSFSRSTIEMVALAAAEDVAVARVKVPRRRGWNWLITSGALVAASLSGFGMGRLLWPDPNRQLLQDLPVLEDLDLYQHADTVEFLHQLDREGVFDEEVDHAT